MSPARSLAAGVLLWALPPVVLAQEPPPAEAPPPQTELVFERETFDYPTYVRRNPFRPLLVSETGPRFEQMRLRGIIYSVGDPGRSVALLGLATPPQAAANASAGAALTEVQDTTPPPVARTQRLKIGETWGNLRIVEINRDNVVVEVEEFGLTERRVMRLAQRGPGGGR